MAHGRVWWVVVVPEYGLLCLDIFFWGLQVVESFFGKVTRLLFSRTPLPILAGGRCCLAQVVGPALSPSVLNQESGEHPWLRMERKNFQG